MFFKARTPLFITGAAVAAGFVLGWFTSTLSPSHRALFAGTEPAHAAPASAPPASSPPETPTASSTTAVLGPEIDRGTSGAGLKSTGDFPSQLVTLQRGVPSPRRDQELSQLFESWAQQDPRSALSAAEKFSEPNLRETLTSSVVAGWVLREPEAAFAWATDPSRTDRYGMIAVEKLAKADPDRAMKLAAALPGRDESFYQQAYGTVITSVANEGRYADARKMVESIPSPVIREQLTSELAGTWGRYQPKQAAQWLLGFPEGSMREGALGNVAYSWAQIDPLGAANFAASLPPGGSRKQALVNTVIAWADKDISSASAWLDKFDAQRDNDAAVAAIATSPKVVQQNPEVALSWAESIVGPEDRAEAIGQIAAQWAERDRNAARKYLEKTNLLDATQRAELIGRLAAPREE
jgi:hypothetical protein